VQNLIVTTADEVLFWVKCACNFVTLFVYSVTGMRLTLY